MDKTQTAQMPEAAAAPQGERTERHLRVLAELAEIQMAVARATQTEAVKQTTPGVDYCARIATVSRSVRLTLLLEEKIATRERDAPPKPRPAAAPALTWHEKSARPAIAATHDGTQSKAGDRLRAETVERPERHERPEAVERVERAERWSEPKAAMSRWDWHQERVKLAVLGAADDGSGSDENERLHTRVSERLEQLEVVEMIEYSPALEAVAQLCRELGLPPEAERWLEAADAMLEEMGFSPEPEDPPAAPGRKRRALDTG
jgi:hypothetical protein